MICYYFHYKLFDWKFETRRRAAYPMRKVKIWFKMYSNGSWLAYPRGFHVSLNILRLSILHELFILWDLLSHTIMWTYMLWQRLLETKLFSKCYVFICQDSVYSIAFWRVYQVILERKKTGKDKQIILY